MAIYFLHIISDLPRLPVWHGAHEVRKQPKRPIEIS
jgi:hypothetical protein